MCNDLEKDLTFVEMIAMMLPLYLIMWIVWEELFVKLDQQQLILTWYMEETRESGRKDNKTEEARILRWEKEILNWIEKEKVIYKRKRKQETEKIILKKIVFSEPGLFFFGQFRKLLILYVCLGRD